MSMTPEKILVPLDLTRCPAEIFSIVKSCADRSGATVILLHVVHLNILSPEARIYDELVADARHYLERLARDYLADIPGLQVRVRIGKLVEGILTEAKA